MSPETLFALCNSGVLPAWLLLAVAPGWIWTQRIVHAIWIPLLLAIAYGLAIGQGWAGGPEGGSFLTLHGVMVLFTDPWAVCGGWIHYLVFDLFVGAWQVRDALRRGIPHLAVLPCLALTFLLGPLGLALYLLVRWARTRATGLAEAD